MSDKPPGWTPARVVAVTVLLAVPFVATLWVGSYARMTPTLIGIPFFYWYLMLWVPITAILTGIAYVLTSRVDRARHEQRVQRARGNEEDGQ